MVCSHEIAASTAQLVAASKVGPTQDALRADELGEHSGPWCLSRKPHLSRVQVDEVPG